MADGKDSSLAQAVGRLGAVGALLREAAGAASSPGAAEYASSCELLLELKRHSREAFLSAADVIKKLETRKKQAEEQQLSLQNLQYEKAYLLFEIERCRNFKPVQTAGIALVPEAEFMASAPRSLLDDLAALEDGSKAKEHQLQLSRLSHELLLRRELKQAMQGLEADKKAVRESTNDQLSFLEGLPAKMTGIVKAAKPLQDHFKAPVLERLGRHQLCHDLPDPLYMVYCQFEAYGDAFGGVRVSVDRSSDDDGLNGESHGDSKAHDAEAPKTAGVKRKRGAAGATGAGAASSASSGKATAKAKAGANGKANGAAALDKAAALRQRQRDCGVSVSARLESPSKSVDVLLRFRYFPALDVVTAAAEKHRGLLANIFPNDTGQFLPHTSMSAPEAGEAPSGAPSGRGRAARAAFPEELGGRPYKWLQWLAGRYALAPERSRAATAVQPSTRSIVECILARVEAQGALSEQLRVLAKRPHPVPVHESAGRLFPASAATKLVTWEEIDAGAAEERMAALRTASASASASSRARAPVFRRRAPKSKKPKKAGALGVGVGVGGAERMNDEDEDDDDDDDDEDEDEETEEAAATAGSWASFGRRCFHGVLQMAGGQKVEAIVQVFVDYPARAPRFSLLPASNGVLRIVESELNDHAEELHAAGGSFQLLSHQLRRLQMCLDVVAKAEAATGAKPKDGQAVDSGARDPAASALERKHRGRDRRLAFVYKHESRSFVHR